MPNKKGITKVLQEYFSGGKNVAVVYLFGSFVSGAVHKFSDVDDQRCDFEVRARQEYFDVRPLLELQYHYMSKRLKEGKFGVKLVEN
ncbi:MAG: nucleotidyltransferase domain-containing protein [bacterium]